MQARARVARQVESETAAFRPCLAAERAVHVDLVALPGCRSAAAPHPIVAEPFGEAIALPQVGKAVVAKCVSTGHAFTSDRVKIGAYAGPRGPASPATIHAYRDSIPEHSGSEISWPTVKPESSLIH